LLKDFNKIPRVLQRFIKQKILPDYKRLTNYMEHHKIPRTSNTVENYYRQTEPEQIKKKYKTITRILTYLHHKMKNWTQKHIKK
ncbi:MAG: transposase, partial [Methanobacteriaceae archaeon]|nr:transposase [Methanobacteriaceae archaeon]